MPEPTTTVSAALTLAAAPPAVAGLTLLGVPLGLLPEVLFAGFAGAFAAIALLNSVPSTGDTWRALIRTTLRRLGVAVTSSFTAGYLVPLLALNVGISSDAARNGLAFVVGAGAQQVLAWAIRKFGTGGQP